MRTEEEMLALIRGTALADDRIRAAYMEGSRVDPGAPKDIFQDYDIVYVVESTAPFRADREWIGRFGSVLYMQYPEDNVFYPADVENCYGWQVQFADGNRMDLHVCTKRYALENLELYRILVDKDGILPPPQETDDRRYWVKAPSEAEFQSTFSDFWWCTNNAAKGLWRGEITYTMDVINFVLRPQLLRLLAWKIGVENSFSVSVGKSGRYMRRYLPEETYAQLLQTYPGTETGQMWRAVFALCALFQETAAALCADLGFAYDAAMAENSLGFLRHVEALPVDAAAVCP